MKTTVMWILSLKIGGRYSNNIITSDVPFFISGMSYGSLKLPAKIALHIALNKLAEDGIKVIMNTGEGGALPWEIHGFELEIIRHNGIY